MQVSNLTLLAIYTGNGNTGQLVVGVILLVIVLFVVWLLRR